MEGNHDHAEERATREEEGHHHEYLRVQVLPAAEQALDMAGSTSTPLRANPRTGRSQPHAREVGEAVKRA